MPGWSRRLLVALALVAGVGCSPSTGPPAEEASRPTATPAPVAPVARPCAVAGFAPTERTDVRRGTRVVVYALPVTLEPRRRGRVPVTLRRLIDLRPGVRAPEGADVDPAVLRRVAASLARGSTGPLADTFQAGLRVRAEPRARRVVAYAETRARPFRWSARVCGAPTTTDGSVATVSGTGLVLDRFRTGSVDCARPDRPPTAVSRQLLARCG